MKQLINGEYIDFTNEEIEEIKKRMPVIEIKESLEDRLQKLEAILTKIAAMLGVKL